MIRNATYTVYLAHELELDRLGDSCYVLRYRGSAPPDNSFQLSSHGVNVYKKTVTKESVENAFVVTTYALYRGYKWQVDRRDGDLLRLSIDREVPISGLTMIGLGWYELWISVKEVEKVWEERTNSAYPLPFPSNVSKILEIDATTL